MQILIDTATDSPALLFKFGALLAAMYETVPVPGGEAGTTINGPAEPLELKPDFKPSDSMAPDAFETTAKRADRSTTPVTVSVNGAGKVSVVPMIPPPPGFPLPPPILAVPVAAAIAIPAATAPVSSTATVVPMIPPPPGVPAPGPEFDSKGVQWSAALHTSTKTKTIDGQWKPRTKRGANTATVSADTMGKTSIQGVVVSAPELPAAIEAFAGPQVPILPPPPMRPPVSANEDDADVSAEDDTATAVDFPTFISNITAGMNAGTVTQRQIDEVQTAHGLSNLFSLSTATPELLAAVSAAFGF